MATVIIAACNIVALLVLITVSSYQFTLTRESNERAYRAWLTVNGGRAPFRAVVNGRAEQEIIYENTGRSPAQHIGFSPMTAVQLPSWTPPDPVPTDPTQQKTSGVVGPGQKQTLYFGRKAPCTGEEIDAITHGRAVLFYVGQVRYEDQFSKSRGLQFCLRYDPPQRREAGQYAPLC